MLLTQRGLTSPTGMILDCGAQLHSRGCCFIAGRCYGEAVLEQCLQLSDIKCCMQPSGADLDAMQELLQLI